MVTRTKSMVRLVLMLTLILYGCGGDALGDKSGPVEMPSAPITLTADFSWPTGSFMHAPGRALSATPGRSNMNSATWAKLGALNLEHVRLWMMFSTVYNLDTKVADLRSPIMGDYFTKYSAIAQKILVNLGYGGSYYQLVETGKWTESQLNVAYLNVLTNFKQRFPKIEYIEVDNEANAQGWSVARYYKTYSKACSLVAQVNALISTGTLPGPRLKVGGPTLYKLDPTEAVKWISPFLDAYVADASADKRLDFLTYHQYLLREFPASQGTDVFKDSPSRVAGDRALIDAAFAARGLPSVPVHVTEGGMYAGPQPADTPTEAYFIKAAGQLAMDYFFQQQEGVVPYRWTVDAIEPVKALFVLDAAGKSTGQARPFYHATAFEAALPPQRFNASVDVDSGGVGLGTLAGGSPTKLGVLVWNYQWTRGASKEFDLVLARLPVAFTRSPVTVTVQVVRQAGGGLEPTLEKSETVAPTESYTNRLKLGPNEFALIELAAN